jgi:hypothetical protein
MAGPKLDDEHQCVRDAALATTINVSQAFSCP